MSDPNCRVRCSEDAIKQTWQLVSDSQEKTLTDQHGQYFMILELVPGKEGGQKTERFKLPYQE